MPKKRPGNSQSSRHEIGVVAPGKRVVKQKSTGTLKSVSGRCSPVNGSSPSSSIPNPELIAASQVIDSGSSLANDRLHTRHRSDAVYIDTSAPPTSFAGQSWDLHTTSTGLDGVRTNGISAGSYPRLSSKQSPSRSSSLRKTGIVSLGLTILRSCPLGDTITVLIILLSIPTTILTLIQALFATLTFMPPIGSFFAIPYTFSEIFQGSGGTPSLATIIITDILGFLVWLAAWTPLQTLIIECAHAVVASKLGGSATDKDSDYDRSLFCVAIITFRHIVSHKWITSDDLGIEWPIILSDIPYFSTKYTTFPYVSDDKITSTERQSSWRWLRILIALHILTQGLVHVARRWFQRREHLQSNNSSNKTVDAEAGSNGLGRPSHDLSVESSPSNSATTSSNPLAKIVTAPTKEARDKVTQAKRKRRQAISIRTQQPLWAAFAVFKVTILRIYEQSRAIAKSTIDSAKDPSQLGSAAFEHQAERFWITSISFDSFTFKTTYSISPHNFDGLSGTLDCTVSEQVRPFDIRMNEVTWALFDLLKTTEGDGSVVWQGTVNGLAPSYIYHCSLLSSENGTAIVSTVVTTLPSPTQHADVSAPTEINDDIDQDATLSSPVSTLKKSLTALDANLTDLQTRQKRTKKEQKNVVAAMRKEIDIINSKISKLSSDDRSHTNRNLQWNQSTKQAEERSVSIDEELRMLGAIPKEVMEESVQSKASWDETKQLQDTTRESLFQAKAARHRDMLSLQSEANSLQQKKERLVARTTKLRRQREKLESTTAELPHGQAGSQSEISMKSRRLRVEQELQEQMDKASRAWQESRYHIGQYLSQSNALENAFQEHQMMPAIPRSSNQRPLTPEGDLPGEKSHHETPVTRRYAAFGTPESIGGLRSHSGSLHQTDVRPRSCSILSGTSNFVDFEDQPEILPPTIRPRALKALRDRGRTHSGGSGGGSSGSVSQRDAGSPVYGMRPRDHQVMATE